MQSAEEEQAGLRAIAEDQVRLRANLEKMPRESETFKRYLKKFDDQESDIEKRRAKAKELLAEAAKAEAAYKEYAEGAKAE
jgi:predicted  nucleic acid-binding Zn-ribbon protein